MRRVVCALSVAAILAVPATASAASYFKGEAGVLVPGVSIRGLHPGDSRARIRAVLGKPSYITVDSGLVQWFYTAMPGVTLALYTQPPHRVKICHGHCTAGNKTYEIPDLFTVEFDQGTKGAIDLIDGIPGDSTPAGVAIGNVTRPWHKAYPDWKCPSGSACGAQSTWQGRSVEFGFGTYGGPHVVLFALGWVNP